MQADRGVIGIRSSLGSLVVAAIVTAGGEGACQARTRMCERRMLRVATCSEMTQMLDSPEDGGP